MSALSSESLGNNFVGIRVQKYQDKGRNAQNYFLPILAYCYESLNNFSGFFVRIVI